MYDFKLILISRDLKRNTDVYTLECPDCKLKFDVYDTDVLLLEDISCPLCGHPKNKKADQADCMQSLIDRIKDEEVYGI